MMGIEVLLPAGIVHCAAPKCSETFSIVGGDGIRASLHGPGEFVLPTGWLLVVIAGPKARVFCQGHFPPLAHDTRKHVRARRRDGRQ